jgi:hypothetical protein
LWLFVIHTASEVEQIPEAGQLAMVYLLGAVSGLVDAGLC